MIILKSFCKFSERKNLFNEQENAPNVFLNELNNLKKTKYKHFAIAYKTELF